MMIFFNHLLIIYIIIMTSWITINEESLSLRLFIGQKKIFEIVTLGSWWAYLNILENNRHINYLNLETLCFLSVSICR